MVIDLKRMLAWLSVVLAACGQPTQTVTTEPDATSSEPTTATSSSPAAIEEYTCPNILGSDDDRTERKGVPEQKLYDDFELMYAYGYERPEVFGGIRFVREASRFEIGFTDDLEWHCEALRDLVEHSNGFDVVGVAHSIVDKWEAIEVAAALGVSTTRASFQPVRVQVPSNALAVAEELHARFGDMLEITVGDWPGLPYPPTEGWRQERCPATTTSEDPPIVVTLDAPDDPLGASGITHIGLTVTALEPGTLHVEGPTVGLSSEPGLPATGRASFIVHATSGVTRQLEAGQSFATAARVGFVPCTLDEGYVLPSGTYVVEGPIALEWNGEPLHVLAEPVTVTWEAPPQTSLPPREPPPTLQEQVMFINGK